MLAPPELPLARTRAEQFDDLVLDAVEDLDASLADDLAALQVAVQDVPDEVGDDLAPDVVSDHGVVLARLLRDGLPDAEPADTAGAAGAAPALGGRPAGPVLVVYRRPVEARAVDPEERADLVLGLVVELVAEWLGRDADEIDPR